MRSLRVKKLLGAALAVLCLGLCVPALAAGLTASCEPASAAAGDAVTFHLQLANDTQYSMQNLSYSADYTGFSFNGPGAVNPGETGAYSSTVSMTDAMLDVPITFTLHWDYMDMNGVLQAQDSATATVTVTRGAAAGPAGAAVTVQRTASSTQASKGEAITITYSLTNNGATELKKLFITDAELSAKELVKDITVAPGETYTFEYAYTMGGSTVKSIPVFTYTVDGETQTATMAEISLGMVSSRLGVEVEQGAPTEEGVSFTLYLTNNGNQKISKIKVKDEQGNSVNGDTFALSVGESKSLTYTVPNETERNVVFYLTGSSASGDAYEDHTKTYTVRRYIDPSLIGLEFSAAVAEPLNQSGSIKVRFSVNNTGSLPLNDLALSEAELGEIRRQASLPLGETVLEETVNVGSPRDMVFTVTVRDEAQNEYTYTANITAAYMGEAAQQAPSSTGTNAIDDIETLGSRIGDSVSNALTVALVILAVLCVLSAAALIVLGVLEQKQKQEAARRRARRERQMRSERADETRQQPRRAFDPVQYTGDRREADYVGGDTIVQPRKPRE